MWRKAPFVLLFAVSWVIGAVAVSADDVEEATQYCAVWYTGEEECCEERGWLGISFRNLSAGETEATGGKGIVVIQVVEDSPAEKVGLEDGDIVFMMNGQEIGDYKVFVKMMNAQSPGDSITLQVRRDGDEFTVGPVLSERPEKVAYRFYGFGKKGYLGVSLIDMTPELREFHGVPSDTGVLIGKVVEESPAAAAGLKVGDIITEVGEEKVESSHDIQMIIREKDEGDEVKIRVSRGGRDRTLTAVIEEKEIKHFNLGRMGAISIPEIHIPEIEVPEIDIDLEEIQPIVIRSVERIRNLLESEEFQEQLEEFRELENELQMKIRALEERLRELEERLREAEEEESDSR